MKNKAELKDISIENLTRNRFQPRQYFDDECLQEMAQSIRSSGIVQPIVVRPLKEKDSYEIVAGERRWRAAQMVGLHKVSCLINHYTDDQSAEIAMVENVNRVDLNPIEEALAYQRLIDQFGYSHDEISVAMGKSRTKITNALRLLKLQPQLQEWLIGGKLSEGHGKCLAGLNKTDQLDLAKKIISRGWSVRKLENQIKKLLQEKDYAHPERDPNIKSLEKKLSEHVGCRTSIDFSEGKGQVKIDFQNLDILEGILSKFGIKENV